MEKSVVIFTYSGDSPDMLAQMTAALAQRGAATLRFDSDLFPTATQATFRQDAAGESVVWSSGEHSVTLGPTDALWYRRARTAARVPQTLEKQLRTACVDESETLLRGLMAVSPCFVLDLPELVKLCGHKPRQQRLAREVGMATPRTLMTNDPVQAADFVRSCAGGAVAKMLSAFAIYTEQQEEQVVFTTALNEDHLSKLAGLSLCPMVFQERIEKRVELRITVIGNRIFTAAVDSASTPGAEVDWRQKGVTLIKKWVPYSLPADIEASIHTYMQRIGMQYSAIDMIVEPSGRHVFLEANPAGEFFWLECHAPFFPLVDALADVLTDQPGARRRGPTDKW